MKNKPTNTHIPSLIKEKGKKGNSNDELKSTLIWWVILKFRKKFPDYSRSSRGNPSSFFAFRKLSNLALGTDCCVGSRFLKNSTNWTSSNFHLLKEGTLEGKLRWSIEAKLKGFKVGFPLQSHLLIHIFMLQDGVDWAPFFKTCIPSTGWLTCRCCICAVDWALLTFLRDIYDVDRVACKGWSMLLIDCL